MEKEIRLNVIDYTKNPGPRYKNQGDHSGEDFYETKLEPYYLKAIKDNSLLVVNLDGPNGYASSFLDQAFGCLVFNYGYSEVLKNVKIISKEEPEWIGMLENKTYIEWEERRKKGDYPKQTDQN